MIFDYHTDGCTITDDDKELIESKIEKLSKFDKRIADESVKVHVEIVRGTRHNKPNYGARVQITIPGGSLRAETSGKTIADAIDEIEKKFRNAITKLDS